MQDADADFRHVTGLLARWKAGETGALAELLPVLYDELRRVARQHLRRERNNHSLQSCALVHEVYLRLNVQAPFDAQSRSHFIRIASRVMRQVLVDHARSQRALKRGAGELVQLDTSQILPQGPDLDVIRLDDALKSLAELDEQQSSIVEMRFFGGLSNEEIAEAQGISVSTVKRDWNVARAWLAREMSDRA